MTSLGLTSPPSSTIGASDIFAALGARFLTSSLGLTSPPSSTIGASDIFAALGARFLTSLSCLPSVLSTRGVSEIFAALGARLVLGMGGTRIGMRLSTVSLTELIAENSSQEDWSN